MAVFVSACFPVSIAPEASQKRNQQTETKQSRGRSASRARRARLWNARGGSGRISSLSYVRMYGRYVQKRVGRESSAGELRRSSGDSGRFGFEEEEPTRRFVCMCVCLSRGASDDDGSSTVAMGRATRSGRSLGDPTVSRGSVLSWPPATR